MSREQLRLRIYVGLLLTIMVVGTLGFMIVEGFSLADAFYFSIVTIATVGYGDIHPATTPGKILTVVLIITGVGTFLGVVANVMEIFLSKRERAERLEKQQMVIGVFFSEVGNRLLGLFSRADPQVEAMCCDLVVKTDWGDRDFGEVRKRSQEYKYTVDLDRIDLEGMGDFLREKSNFLIRLLENPSLHEHEAFTDLLRAVFHLHEELQARETLTSLTAEDSGHIRGDIKRGYRQLVLQWLDYMKYLQTAYPFLFSLALRMNPFDQNASPVVR